MAPFIHFSTLLTSLAMLHGAKSKEVSLGINTLLNQNEKQFFLGGTSFIELVSKGVFMDKTLFINAILSDYLQYHFMALVCPVRWGKSMNFDMLKTFLTIQLHPNGTRMLPITSTPNYQLFTKGEYHWKNTSIKLEKPLLISNPAYKHIIDRYLGRFVIINISLTNILSTPGKDDFDMLRQILSDTFREHEYMVGIYDDIIKNKTVSEYLRKQAEKDKREFLTILNRETTKHEDLVDSVNILGEKLCRHFNTKVVILVDDFHLYAYCDVFHIIVEILSLLIDHNDDIERVIFAGDLPLQTDLDPKLMEFLRSPLYIFNGFTKEEMNLLYRVYQIPADEQAKIRYWYGGYRTIWNLTDEIFNGWSICNYLNTRQFKLYWKDVNVRDIYFEDIYRAPVTADLIDGVVNVRGYEDLLTSYKFRWDQLIPTNISASDKAQAGKYMISAGYLTIGNESTTTPILYTYVVPNFEVSTYLTKVYGKRGTNFWHP